MALKSPAKQLRLVDNDSIGKCIHYSHVDVESTTINQVNGKVIPYDFPHFFGWPFKKKQNTKRSSRVVDVPVKLRTY